MKLDVKRVVVAGRAGDIGGAIARRMAMATIAVADLSAEKAGHSPPILARTCIMFEK